MLDGRLSSRRETGPLRDSKRDGLALEAFRERLPLARREEPDGNEACGFQHGRRSPGLLKGRARLSAAPQPSGQPGARSGLDDEDTAAFAEDAATLLRYGNPTPLFERSRKPSTLWMTTLSKLSG